MQPVVLHIIERTGTKLKKYEHTLTTRLPNILVESMKDICSQLNVNESDFVRKSLAAEIQRMQQAKTINKFEYI